MPKCKKSEGQAIDYAYKLLPPTAEEPFQEHLKSCKDCTDAVKSYTAALELTDTAQEAIVVPEHTLQNIEMNVYKRARGFTRTDVVLTAAHLPYECRIALRLVQNRCGQQPRYRFDCCCGLHRKTDRTRTSHYS